MSGEYGDYPGPERRSRPPEPYSGPERRRDPSAHQLFERMRAELDSQEERLTRRLDQMERNQEKVERKLDRWETGGAVIRWAVLAFGGVAAALASVFEWFKEHVR